MQPIASFTVNHDLLTPGIYTSRVDGDVCTYDIRLCKPNTPPYLPQAALHTIEHLFATFARNGEDAAHVLYFGPMGCRTGFYLLVRDLPPARAIALIVRCFRQIVAYSGPIPGAARSQCGNYREHDLPGAVAQARAFLPVIADWTPARLAYAKA